jgi:predicted MFS family arabinose efflux permease
MIAKTDPWRIFVACAAAYCAANITVCLAPAIMLELLARAQIDASRAGLVISIELVVTALGSVLLARWLKDIPLLRVGAGGVMIMLIGAAASLFASRYEPLLAARILTGMGEAVPLMISSALLARFADPDRVFAGVSAITVIFGMMIFYVLPALEPALGPQAAFPAMLVCLLLLAPLQLLLPRNTYMAGEPVASGSSTKSGAPGRLVLIAAMILIVLVPSGAMWSFSGVLGAKAGLNANDANTAITIAGLMSLPGTFAATCIGGRFGRVRPILFGILALTGAVISMSNSPDPFHFRISACVNSAAAYFLMPFFFGFAATEDDSGKGGVVAGSCFLMMNAMGPYVGGLMFEHLSSAGIAGLVACANVAVCLALLLLHRRPGSAKPS